MRILLSAFACEPGRGSEPGFGWNAAVALTRQGHKVWVLTTEAGRTAIEAELRQGRYPGLHVMYIAVSSHIRRWVRGQAGFFLSYLLWQWHAYQRALHLDQKIGFDVIHHITYGSLQGGTWLWRLNKPLVFGPVGGGQIAPPAFKRYFESEWGKEYARSLLRCKLAGVNPLTVSTLRRASVTLVTNSDTGQMAKRLGGPRVEYYLDTSLPSEFFPKDIPHRQQSETLKVLWVGSIIPRKALTLALDAFARLDASRSIQLVIAGGGRWEGRVQGWILQRGIENKVSYRGVVGWEEIKELYRTSDLFLFTSLRDSFGAQVLEAMAYALPVVVLDHHGTRDAVPDEAGIKVPVTSPEETIDAIAQAICYLHDHPQERIRMGQAGYELARQHTWEHFSRNMEAIYETLQQGQPGKKGG